MYRPSSFGHIICHLFGIIRVGVAAATETGVAGNTITEALCVSPRSGLKYNSLSASNYIILG